jgi:hypothetical protein
MNHIPFSPSHIYSLPVISLAIVGLCREFRRIVKAIADLAVYVLQEFGRVVRAYRRATGMERRGLRVRGQASRKPNREITPTATNGRSRRNRPKGKIADRRHAKPFS